MLLSKVEFEGRSEREGGIGRIARREKRKQSISRVLKEGMKEAGERERG